MLCTGVKQMEKLYWQNVIQCVVWTCVMVYVHIDSNCCRILLSYYRDWWLFGTGSWWYQLQSTTHKLKGIDCWYEKQNLSYSRRTHVGDRHSGNLKLFCLFCMLHGSFIFMYWCLKLLFITYTGCFFEK